MKNAIWVLRNVLLQLAAEVKDWTAKWLKRVLLIILAALVLAAGVWFAVREVRLAIARAQMEEAVSIRFVYPEFGMNIFETEYDLGERVMCDFSCGLDHKGRDPQAENGGWSSIEPLTEQQVSDIRRVCAPMLLWKESYVDFAICDGWIWFITITFRDGSTREIGGSNACPWDYDRVMSALGEARQAE